MGDHEEKPGLPSVIPGLNIDARAVDVQPISGDPSETGSRLFLTSTGSLAALSDGNGVLIQFGELRDMEALIMALIHTYNSHVQYAAARGQLMNEFVGIMRQKPRAVRPTVPGVGNA